MNRTDYPNIKEYRYHFNAFYLCKTFAQVEAVAESVKKVVKPDHTEFEPLLAAGRQRWFEIKEQIENKEVK